MPKLQRQIQYNPRGNIDGLVEDAINAAKEDLAFAYNGDGTVSNISGLSTDIDFVYNGDKTVNTIDDQVFISTFAYNGNKTVNTITLTPS